MKTIIIRAEVPEDISESKMYEYIGTDAMFELDYEIIPEPTEKEIIAFAESVDVFATHAQNRVLGARWAIEQIMK